MEDIRKIPPVQAYLLDIEIFTQLKQVAEKHGIDEKRVDEFLDLTDAVTKGELEVANMPALAAQAFGIDDAKAKALCADIAGYRLLPLANYIDGVESAVTSWGGKIDDYPKNRIPKQQRDIDERIRELATELQLELPEHLMKRFIFVVRGYATGERTKEATATLMKRPLNIGGLHMNDTQVQNMLALIEKEKDQLVDRKEESQPAPAQDSPTPETKKAAEPEVPAPEPEPQPEEESQPKISSEELRQRLQTSQEDYLTMLREFGDVDVVEELPPEAAPAAPKKETKKSAPAKKKETSEEQPPHSDDEQLPAVKAPAEVAAEVPVINKPKKRKRKRRKRKKKNGNSATTETTQESEKGTPQKPERKKPESKKVAVKKEPSKSEKKIEKPSAPPPVTSPTNKEGAVNQALAPVVEIFKKNRIAKKVFASVATAHVKGRRDPLKTYELLKTEHKLSGADLDAAFKALEQGRKIAQGEYQPGKNVTGGTSEDTKSLEKEVLDKRHAAMTKKVADQSVDPVLPSGQVSAARSKKEELEVQRSKIDEEKVKKAQEASRPKKAKAKLSMKSAPPSDGAKKMQDVKFVQKLVGPVEELGMMSAPEFRRLSSDPSEATQKILDKLSLLQESSYDQRISGVKAWRSSPINKLYLKMANDALMKGISVQEVASARRNAGEESLKPAEIQAIVALNSKISF